MRLEDGIGNAGLVEGIWLVGNVGIQGFDASFDEIVEMALVRDEAQLVEGDALVEKHRLQLDILIAAHQRDLAWAGAAAFPVAGQIDRPLVAAMDDQHVGRMLEYRPEHQYRLALEIIDHQAGDTDAEIGPPGEDFRHRVGAGAAFLQGDGEARLAIKALLQRRVVAGKLKLVHPAQLQCDLIQGPGRLG